jgi:anthranilate/para-aminobenzoate synthase component I
VWLRLAGGTQELFACWPEQVICVCGRKLEHVTAAGVRLFAGDADALWTLLRKGLQTLPPLPGLPFAGGWLGVIGYGAGGLSQNEGPRLPFPDVLLGDYRRFVFIDHTRQTAELMTLAGLFRPAWMTRWSIANQL